MIEALKFFFKERFGIDLKGYKIIFRGEIFWLNSVNLPSSLKLVSLGIPIARLIKKKEIKPTTWGLILLDKKIKKNKIELNEKEIKKILVQQKLKKELKIDDGFVALSFRRKTLGCALYENKLIKSQLPKQKRDQLLRIFNL
jgi:NOL1/NOP2/fmu family ribosome biogenesis protein